MNIINYLVNKFKKIKIKNTKSKFIGKKCIVRCDGAGVFFGTLEEITDSCARISNVRQLWYWSGAASLMEMAKKGVKRPENCKFTVTVSEIEVDNVVQVLPCTEEAIKSIEGVKSWEA